MTGRPLDKRSDWVARKAPLKPAAVHEVRPARRPSHRSDALLSEGVHPQVVMELLGHSQMRTSTDTYSHVMPALAKEAAAKMGNALWG